MMLDIVIKEGIGLLGSLASIITRAASGATTPAEALAEMRTAWTAFEEANAKATAREDASDRKLDDAIVAAEKAAP